MEDCTGTAVIDYKQTTAAHIVTASSVADGSSLDNLFDTDFNTKFQNNLAETFSPPWILVEYPFEASYPVVTILLYSIISTSFVTIA